LRESHYDYGVMPEQHRQLADVATASSNSKCVPLDDVNSLDTSKRWYCWSSCNDLEGGDIEKDPLVCPPQYMQWPPSFCKKGTEDCVGPYIQPMIWKKNPKYDDKEDAVGDNWSHEKVPADYEIGYNWSRASKYENMFLKHGAHGYVEEYWDTLHCYSFILLNGTQLMPRWILSFAYLLAVSYLFLGVAIVSDIFMEAIEAITSQTK